MLARDLTTASANGNQTITAVVGESIVLNCPFKSYPAANFSWYFNKTTIFSNGKDVGHLPASVETTTQTDGSTAAILDKQNRRVKVLGYFDTTSFGWGNGLQLKSLLALKICDSRDLF